MIRQQQEPSLTLPNRVEIERLFSQFHARLPANLKDLVSGSQLNLHYLAEGIVIDVKLDVPMSANEAQDKLQRDERQLRTLAQFYRTQFADVDGIAKVRVFGMALKSRAASCKCSLVTN